MNRVYDVRYKTEGTYYPVGGENRSKAILNYISETSGDTWEFIHYRATLARDYNGKPIQTEHYRILDMKELIPKGYRTWWECEECGDEDCFEYAEIDQYRCKHCGHVGNIPFAE
jgi:hypothetical protein